MPDSTQRAELSYFVLGGERYELATSIELEVTREACCWTCYSSKLNLCGFGPQLEDAVEDARQSLANRWLEVVWQDDANLTLPALATKSLLLELLPLAEQDSEHESANHGATSTVTREGSSFVR
jgi:hypothetical protein